jgi:Protein of unknown function (DUF1761)
MRVNWAAVGVSGVVYWLLQAAWFTVFSQQWQAGLRMSADELAGYKAHPNFLPYLIALLCNLFMAFVIARVLALGGVHSLIRGFRIGLLIGFVAAAAMLTEMHFEVRTWNFILISAGCPVVGCALMGIILGVWRPKNALPEAAVVAGSR